MTVGVSLFSELLRYQHVNPPEAVQIHQDIGCRHSVGMHWGTFHLGREVSWLHFLLGTLNYESAHWVINGMSSGNESLTAIGVGIRQTRGQASVVSVVKH